MFTREERSFLAAVVVLALAGGGWLLAGRLRGGGDVNLPGTPVVHGQAEAVREVEGAPGDALQGSGPGSPAAGGMELSSDPPAEPDPPADEPPIVVHVAGAVVRPGVYPLPAGARVIDAVKAAGGGTDEAALDALNLAAPAADGARIYVPTVEEVAAWTAAGPQVAPTPAAPVGGVTGGSVGPGPISLNRASAADLERLPGIGPVLAERIVAYRERNGPFARVEDLLAVSGIGPRLLERIRPHLTVP